MIGFIICAIIIIVVFIVAAFLMQWTWDRWYYAGGFLIVWYMVWNITNYLLQQDIAWLIQIILRIIGLPVYLNWLLYLNWLVRF